MSLRAEGIPGFLCYVLVINTHTLIATLTTIPKPLDGFLAPYYLLILQQVVTIIAVQLFYRVTNQTFRFRSKKMAVLIFMVFSCCL
jgi:hypothetical protein